VTIIAIDPGVTTGIAIRDSTDQLHTTIVHRQKDLWAIIDKHEPYHVVYEEFKTPGHISKDGLHTVRLIGAIECYCYTKGIRTILQHPSERRGWLFPAKNMLKASGKKFLEHEIDALAHLLLYEDRVQRGVLDDMMKLRRTNHIEEILQHV